MDFCRHHIKLGFLHFLSSLAAATAIGLLVFFINSKLVLGLVIWQILLFVFGVFAVAWWSTRKLFEFTEECMNMEEARCCRHNLRVRPCAARTAQKTNRPKED
jgi:hypothetical protein